MNLNNIFFTLKSGATINTIDYMDYMDVLTIWIKTSCAKTQLVFPLQGLREKTRGLRDHMGYQMGWVRLSTKISYKQGKTK